MRKQCHILNGDSLKQQFPKSIDGELIVARECLVDGDVKGNSLEELFDARAQFISQNYEGFTAQDYYSKSVLEFRKIQNIAGEMEINLWFEDDLFCQVNLWFVVFLLNNSQQNHSVFLVRPIRHNQYGFGGLSESELITIYQNRFLLTKLDEIAKLWEFYQKNDMEKLLEIAKKLESDYPFMFIAVKAHMARNSTKGNLGRPKKVIAQLMQELETEDFGVIFKEFSKRESIYGFGDLQVKRLFDEIKNKQNCEKE